MTVTTIVTTDDGRKAHRSTGAASSWKRFPAASMNNHSAPIFHPESPLLGYLVWYSGAYHPTRAVPNPRAVFGLRNRYGQNRSHRTRLLTRHPHGPSLFKRVHASGSSHGERPLRPQLGLPMAAAQWGPVAPTRTPPCTSLPLPSCPPRPRPRPLRSLRTVHPPRSLPILRPLEPMGFGGWVGRGDKIREGR